MIRQNFTEKANAAARSLFAALFVLVLCASCFGATTTNETLATPPRGTMRSAGSAKPESADDKLVVTLLTGFVGTLIGACVAYFSDWVKERRKTRNEQCGGLIRAQLALITQFNTIHNIRQQYLDPLRNDPARVQKLIQFEMEDTKLRVPFDSISFLLSTKYPNVVLDVHSAEQSYVSAMGVLASRNAAFNELHDRSILESMDKQTGRCVIIANPRRIKLLEDLTGALYRAVDTAGERLAREIENLQISGKVLFPKKKFLQIAGEK